MIDLETLDVETASVLLGRYAVKCAAAAGQEKQAADEYMDPMLGGTLRGAGVGALGGAGIGALLTALQRKKRKNWLANILFGAAGGAGLGGAYGAATSMPAPKALPDRAAAANPDAPALAAQLNLPPDYNHEDLQKVIETGSPAEKQVAKTLLEASGYKQITEPGLFTERGANTAGRIAAGTALGAGVGGGAGLAYGAKRNIPVVTAEFGKGYTDVDVANVIKNNPQLNNIIKATSGVHRLEKLVQRQEQALEQARAQVQNQAKSQIVLPPGATANTAAARLQALEDAYKATQKDLADAKIRQSVGTAQVADSRLAPAPKGKGFVLQDSTGKNVTHNIGRGRLNDMVGTANRDLRVQRPAATKVPYRPMRGPGVWGSVGGALAGGMAGAATDWLFGGSNEDF